VLDRGVHLVDDMLDLPKKLRSQLSSGGMFRVGAPMDVVTEQVSQKDGTVKRLYRLEDGNHIESVLMGPYRDGRMTACISSQAGCAMGCVFCATGQMGIRRQLTASEIVTQVWNFDRDLKLQKREDGDGPGGGSSGGSSGGGRISNVVFMGMGEPLANYRNVMSATNFINKDIGISARRITVSTVGVVPSIQRLTKDANAPPVNLAVSLHCANDRDRTALIPANKQFGGLDALMESVSEYHLHTKRRVTFEWTLIAGENDSIDTARELSILLKRFGLDGGRSHVNVIPMNPTAGFPEGSPSQANAVELWCREVNSGCGVSVTPRVRRGIDIDAGCGQLARA
jgi:23S rRNA (adenine2503-C2)-methyltransferase